MLRTRFCIAMVVPALWWGAALGQTTSAELTGRIVDPSDAVIQGAEVVVTNEDTGVRRQAASNELGYYTAPLLNQGSYRVVVRKEGFKPITRSGIVLRVGQAARIDFVMELGSVAENIVVSGTTPLVESEKPDVGQVVDGKRILEMPLIDRNYLQLAQFTPGVVPTINRTGEEGGFNAVGAYAYQNNVLLDGNDNSARAGGGAIGYQTQATKPPVDAVAEFKVLTNHISAEYGYRVGGTILVSTRTGTNELHGSVYEFLRNEKFDGTNFFANRAGARKPPYRQNQFGGTLGGPVIRDRTFFFGSYQGTRIRLGRTYTSTVPSRDMVSGNFSKAPANRRNIFDPLTLSGSGSAATRLAFPGNRIPVARLDPVAKTIADLYPAPNIAGREDLPNNYFYGPSNQNNSDQYDFRLDHNFSAAHRVFGRYSLRNQKAYDPGALPLPADGNSAQTTRYRADSVTLNYTASLGPSRYNELRFGYTRFATRFDLPYTENLNKKYGIKGAPGDTLDDGLDYGLALFTPAEFTALGSKSNWPNVNNLNNLLIADSMSIQVGRHIVKFGGEFRRADILRDVSKVRRGLFTFGASYTVERPNDGGSRANTGSSMADLLLGMPAGATISNKGGEETINGYYGFFVQDDWKITPRLTAKHRAAMGVFPDALFPQSRGQPDTLPDSGDQRGGAGERGVCVPEGWQGLWMRGGLEQFRAATGSGLSGYQQDGSPCGSGYDLRRAR